MLSRVHLFENAFLMLHCGRVKTELFENSDVTASICYISEHTLGSWESREGILPVCFLSSKLKHRILNVTASWCVDDDIFQNAPRVEANIFHADTKRCVCKNIWMRVDAAIMFNPGSFTE